MTGRHVFTRGAPARWLVLATMTLLAAAHLTACSSGSANTVALPTATRGAVQVAVEHTSYATNQVIGVTVSNTATKTDYYAMTGKSVCTYLQLEEYDSGKKTWVAVDGCQTADQPRLLLIQHASSLPFTLTPSSPANQNQWGAGTYRVLLQYTTDYTGSSGFQTAYSAGFTITGG